MGLILRSSAGREKGRGREQAVMEELKHWSVLSVLCIQPCGLVVFLGPCFAACSDWVGYSPDFTSLFLG